MRKNEIHKFTWLINKSTNNHSRKSVSIAVINPSILDKKSKTYPKSLTIEKSYHKKKSTIIKSYSRISNSPKMRFFELFLIKKRILITENLSKRVWVDGSRDRLSWSRWVIMASVVPYLTNSSAAFFITYKWTGMTDRSNHDVPSRVSIPLYLKFMKFL